MVGVKLTEKLQLAPATREPVQVPLLMVKFAFAGEVMAIVGVGTVVPVWLVSKTGQGAELAPVGNA